MSRLRVAVRRTYRDACAFTAAALWAHGRWLAWPLILAGPLWGLLAAHTATGPRSYGTAFALDGAFALAGAAAAAGGALLQLRDATPRSVPRTVRFVTVAAIALFAAVLADLGQQRPPPAVVSLGLLSTACAAAGARIATRDDDRRWPLWVAIGVLLGVALPVRFVWLELGDRAVILPVVGMLAAARLLTGPPRLVAAVVTAAAAASCAVPLRHALMWNGGPGRWLSTPVEEWILFGVRRRLLIGLWGLFDGPSPWLVAGVAAVAYLAWRAVSGCLVRSSAATASARAAERVLGGLQRRPYATALVLMTLAAVPWAVWCSLETRLAHGWGRTLLAIPGIVALPAAALFGLAALAVHLTAHGPDLLRRAAVVAAVPLAMLPVFVLALTLRWVPPGFWIVALVGIAFSLWAVGSSLLFGANAHGRPIGHAERLLLVAAALGCALPMHDSVRLLFGHLPRSLATGLVPIWLVLIPVAVHAVVVSDLSPAQILRGTRTLAIVSGLALAVPQHDWIASLALIPLVAAGWFAAGCAVIVAQRARSLTAIPADHPRFTDFGDADLSSVAAPPAPPARAPTA